MNDIITAAVRHCYWEKDVNCARTTLYTLAKLADLAVDFLTAQPDLHFPQESKTPAR